MRYGIIILSFILLSGSLTAELNCKGTNEFEKLVTKFRNIESNVQSGINSQISSNVKNSARLAFWGGIVVVVLGSIVEEKRRPIIAGLMSIVGSYFPYYYYENDAFCTWKSHNRHRYARVENKLEEIKEKITKDGLHNSTQGKQLQNEVEAFQERLKNLCQKCENL